MFAVTQVLPRVTVTPRSLQDSFYNNSSTDMVPSRAVKCQCTTQKDYAKMKDSVSCYNVYPTLRSATHSHATSIDHLQRAVSNSGQWWEDLSKEAAMVTSRRRMALPVIQL